VKEKLYWIAKTGLSFEAEEMVRNLIFRVEAKEEMIIGLSIEKSRRR
jgi:hypothetical protein